MTRFWTEALAVEAEGGFGIALDGRPVRTPARALLVVPAAPLAEAIAEEWNGVEDKIDPREMPLTGLANAAIDRVAPARTVFAHQLASYGESDLICYRADGPPELVRRQSERWDALLAWARRRFDVDLVTTDGLLHVAQPKATIDRLGHAVATLDAFRLAGLAPLVTIGGSLVAGLALLEGALSAEEAWQAVTVDERWQFEQWGSDAEAEAALDSRRKDFFAAARFVGLLET